MKLGNKNENLFKLHNIDARKIDKVIKNKIIDVIITSPPYYNMKDYEHEDQIGFGQDYNDYLEDLKYVSMTKFQHELMLSPGVAGDLIRGYVGWRACHD